MKTIQPKSNLAAVAVLILAALTLPTSRGGASSAMIKGDGAHLIGNWTGDSICVGPFPACRDEKSSIAFPKRRMPKAR